jgi:3-methyladenine DNA glycosylase AlkC
MDQLEKAPRKGARSRGVISPAVLAALNAGHMSAATLAECLAVDQAALLRAIRPDLDAATLAAMEAAASLGITRRMALAAEALLARDGLAALPGLTGHPSDTVRGWAAFLIGRAPGLTLGERLDRLRPLADDPHFGVREWAWLALRPHIIAELEAAIGLLQPWTREASPHLRRFAVEGTRPRGVWSAHIGMLRRNPALGLPLLEPLRADPAAYVQDSVANWINDAAKDQPEWARALCARWRAEAPSPATERICRRALRSLG